MAYMFRKKHMTTSILLAFKIYHWKYEGYNTAASHCSFNSCFTILCTDALEIPVLWVSSVFDLIRAFNVYIRPILEYASNIWSPIQIGLIDKLESVQRRYTKQFPGFETLSYTDRLSSLNLESLELRRLRADLIMSYKHIWFVRCQ